MHRALDLEPILGARPSGEVAEWSNAPHSKCGIPARVSWVRIPPSPPEPSHTRSGVPWNAISLLKIWRFQVDCASVRLSLGHTFSL